MTEFFLLIRRLCKSFGELETHRWKDRVVCSQNLTNNDVLLFITPRQTAQNEKNANVRRVLQGIIQKQDSDGNIQLVNVKRLRAQLKIKPLCLDHFLERLDRAVRYWMKAAFAIEDEENIHPPPDSPSRMIRRLRASRATLNAQGEDPLEESYAMAVAAVGGSRRRSRSPSSRHRTPSRKRARGALLAKKKSAHSIEFDDDLEDDDDDDSDDGATNGSNRGLSDMPRRRRKSSITRKSPIKPSQQKQYSGRRIFSDEEKRAIKEGMRQGLTGKWAEIKELYSVILADRTSGQIKVSTRLECACNQRGKIFQSHTNSIRCFKGLRPDNEKAQRAERYRREVRS
jgi:hypothetical protein